MQHIDFSIEKDKYWGAKHWLPFHFPSMKITPKLLDLALQLSSESVTYHCQHLLGHNYFRLNGELGEEMPFDEVKFMDELIKLGKQVFLNKREEVMNFLNKKA